LCLFVVLVCVVCVGFAFLWGWVLAVGLVCVVCVCGVCVCVSARV